MFVVVMFYEDDGVGRGNIHTYAIEQKLTQKTCSGLLKRPSFPVPAAIIVVVILLPRFSLLKGCATVVRFLQRRSEYVGFRAGAQVE